MFFESIPWPGRQLQAFPDRQFVRSNRQRLERNRPERRVECLDMVHAGAVGSIARDRNDVVAHDFDVLVIRQRIEIDVLYECPVSAVATRHSIRKRHLR